MLISNNEDVANNHNQNHVNSSVSSSKSARKDQIKSINELGGNQAEKQDSTLEQLQPVS